MIDLPKCYCLYNPSHMNTTFKEKCREQQKLESGLADRWGYTLTPTPADLKEKKQVESARPVVANITLRKFGREIGKTERIRQVEDEIRGIENERMLREMKESRCEEGPNEKSEVINLMEQMIEDYNRIIEHRHISARSPRDDKSQPRERKANQQLLDLITAKKNLLLTADLQGQIRINKEIAQLYREFNDFDNNLSSVSLKNNRSQAPEAPVSYRTMKKHQSETFDKLEELASLENLNKFLSLKMSNSDEKIHGMVKILRKKSDVNGDADAIIIKKFKDLQMRKYRTMARKHSVSLHHTFHTAQAKPQKRAKNTLEKDLNEPYLDKREVEEYRDLENKIKSNSDAMDLWRNKIFEASRKEKRRSRQTEKTRERERKKGDCALEHREEQIERALDRSINIISVEHPPAQTALDRQRKEGQRQHEKEKEQIFAELLRKRNNKFNKLWGTRILVKYDFEEQAKSMLKGESDRPPPRATKSSMSHYR